MTREWQSNGREWWDEYKTIEETFTKLKHKDMLLKH